MLQQVVNFCRGHVTVRVESGFPERVLNLCAARQIPFWDLRWETPLSFTFTMTRRSFRELRRHGDRLGAEMRVVGKEGLPFFARRFRRRYVLVTGLGLCASHGLQTEEEFRALRAAGVTRYHANLETSRRNFPNICTTHTYEDKVENIRRARAAGLEICSGGILGMGETWEDRIDMALDLAWLEVASIPLNLLTPIPGTPMEGTAPMTDEEVFRSVAIFRCINPRAWIRMAAGRRRFPDGGARLFQCGANSAITGDMLTTLGTGVAEDRDMLTRLGYQL